MVNRLGVSELPRYCDKRFDSWKAVFAGDGNQIAWVMDGSAVNCAPCVGGRFDFRKIHVPVPASSVQTTLWGSPQSNVSPKSNGPHSMNMLSSPVQTPEAVNHGGDKERVAGTSVTNRGIPPEKPRLRQMTAALACKAQLLGHHI